MLTLLRELQYLWEVEGEHDAAVANAARLLAECLTDVTCDADLIPGAPPAVPWKDTLGVKCSPPSPSLRPSAGDVSDQCPRMARVAGHLLKDEVFEALPWKAPAQLSEHFTRIMGEGDECKLKSAMLIGDPKFGAFQHSSQFYVGLMHVAPDAHYPAHCHDAREFYQLISGSAQWWRGGAGQKTNGVGETAVLVPGEFRHHASQEPHGLATGYDESVMCFYFWCGDLPGKYWFLKDVDLKC